MKTVSSPTRPSFKSESDPIITRVPEAETATLLFLGASLPAFQFQYQQIQAPKSSAFPAGRLIKRPVLVVALRNGQSRFKCYAIVDSGADHCVSPRAKQPVSAELPEMSLNSQTVQKFLNAGDAQCPRYLTEADSTSGSPPRALSHLFSRAMTLESSRWSEWRRRCSRRLSLRLRYCQRLKP